MPQVFRIEDEAKAGKAYVEFLRSAALSAGVYRLRAGQPDLQSPHTEDEIYYVVAGKAHIQVSGEDEPIESGQIAFVPANAEHHFHSITEDLVLLVVFAPPEYSRSGDAWPGKTPKRPR